MYEDLELAVMRLAWRVDALDKWRDQVDVRLLACEDGVKRMVDENKIAAAVTEKISARNRLELTLGQKLIGLVVGAVALADGLKGLLH